MKRYALLSLLLALPAAAHPPTVPLHSADYHPNPNFVPVTPSRLWDVPMGQVRQVGEIAILEGDSELVSDDGQGTFAIDYNQNNPVAITQRFFSVYDDAFDEIIVLTTFDDQGAPGALAYEMSTQQDVRGIGQQLFDDSGPEGWGGVNHKLHAFVNMMRWSQFTDMDGLPLTDSRSSFYSTLGQEFAHRWLASMRYVDGTGRASTAMLGRAMVHWASTLQADASVMDGNRLVDNHNGTFTVAETFMRYSPLDLYGMGLLAPREVPPWFRVTNAMKSNGSAVDPTLYLRLNSTIHGGREDISIDQVIAAEGARTPSWKDAQHDFRVAFVLLTRPGESAADVEDIARTIDQVRPVWEQVFGGYAGHRGTMCTQISAPCGAPTAKVIAGRFAEAGGNHNGIVEPGEPATVTVTLANDGPAVASDVAVTLSSDRVQVKQATLQAAQPIPSGQQIDVTFPVTIPADAQCNVPLLVSAQAVTAGNSFRGFAQVVPGVGDGWIADFADGAAGFGVDLDGQDSATHNGWAWGEPLEYRGLSGYLFQPGAGHAGGKRVWLTGLSRGHRLAQDSSLGVGTSTLWSPPIDLRKTIQPSLEYYLWYQAIDFSNPRAGGVTNDNIPFTVEGSSDGGATWFPLEQVTGAVPSWQKRDIDLAALHVDTSRPLVVRFTATNPAPDQLVEAGIDDLRVITLSAGCNPSAQTAGPSSPVDGTVPTAGGCSVGPRGASSGLVALAVFALLALALRRRAL